MLRLIEHDVTEEAMLSVFPEEVHDDVLAGLGKRLLHRREAVGLTMRGMAWEVTHRILRVQRWSQYYGISTTTYTALATGLLDSRRR